MATQNRISIFIWVRSFLALLLIGLILPIGSVSAQTQSPGLLERQRPVVNTTQQNPAAGANIGPMDATNVIQDSSFEASFGSEAYWSQFSTNFGTPICPSTAPSPTGCGNGSGTAGPHTGSAWAWFGGTTATEVGALAQTVNFPSSCSVTLQFYLWIGAAQSGSSTSDYFAVSIDSGPAIFQVNATQKGSYSTYKLVSINLQGYADGNPHTINLISSTSGQIVTFNVDDVSLVIGNCTCGAIVQGAAAMNSQNDNFNDQLAVAESTANTVGPLSAANGSDTTGVFRPSNGALYLKNTNATGFADVQINYGLPGDCPVTGDWDGNGTDTIGIYRNGVFYLRNSNTIGFADIVFAFGAPGDQPIAGDWNGDGVDTIGVYRSTTITFYLRNSNTPGAPEMSFALGNPGDVGLAGDWDGNGTDTTGVFRPSNGALYLKNSNTTGFADIVINYGLPGDKPVTGDWNNDGIDTIGIYRNGAFYLRNSNTIGFADMVFALGVNGDLPIAGNWDALP
jgi:hypothetical protein